jgi:hypothetical protein
MSMHLRSFEHQSPQIEHSACGFTQQRKKTKKKRKLFYIHLSVKQLWSGQKHLIGSQVFDYSLPDYN